MDKVFVNTVTQRGTEHEFNAGRDRLDRSGLFLPIGTRFLFHKRLPIRLFSAFDALAARHFLEFAVSCIPF
ncbi:MAG: hypothetical protein DMG97_33310 [Acidobacteria bacterium]|nr:MAG: hypothetical protein DMG97_33310 [Acidobacteriota bacterium]PYV75171.1 MAG: hypothetical protein DMG96_18075 [Acidobacteriota bacterium]